MPKIHLEMKCNKKTDNFFVKTSQNSIDEA